MKLVAATGNKHKLVEFEAITKQFGFELVPKSDVGLGDFDPEEPGETFQENSLIKAKAICERCGLPCIADDSGLIVDALDGRPGVHSARYAGGHGDDAANRRKVLDELKDVPEGERTARFCSAITLIWPRSTDEADYPAFAEMTEDGYPYLRAVGYVEGAIAFEEIGENGFGYDNIFIPMGFKDTFGILPSDLKNSISHRANALCALQSQLSRAGRR